MIFGTNFPVGNINTSNAKIVGTCAGGLGAHNNSTAQNITTTHQIKFKDNIVDFDFLVFTVYPCFHAKKSGATGTGYTSVAYSNAMPYETVGIGNSGRFVGLYTTEDNNEPHYSDWGIYTWSINNTTGEMTIISPSITKYYSGNAFTCTAYKY